MNQTYIEDPYFDTERCIERLYHWYKQHKTLIVAFDYDDTVYDFHKQGYKYAKVIKLLQACQGIGLTLLLFTSIQKVSELKTIKEKLLKDYEIEVNYINESPIMKETKKPYYNILLDDKAGLGQAYEILNTVVRKIWRKSL